MAGASLVRDAGGAGDEEAERKRMAMEPRVEVGCAGGGEGGEPSGAGWEEALGGGEEAEEAERRRASGAVGRIDVHERFSGSAGSDSAGTSSDAADPVGAAKGSRPVKSLGLSRVCACHASRAASDSESSAAASNANAVSARVGDAESSGEGVSAFAHLRAAKESPNVPGEGSRSGGVEIGSAAEEDETIDGSSDGSARRSRSEGFSDATLMSLQV